MNRRWIGIWGCIAAMCAAAGCSSDGVSGQEDALECGDGENSESGKTPVQPSDPCKWSCQEGTYVCGESGVMKCVKSEGDECPVMILDKTCPDGTNCNARTHECDPDCRSVCEENDTKCIENGYVTCRPDDSGCLKWGGETACLEDEHCVNGKCVSSCPDGNCEEPCTDECEPGQSVCNDNQIRTCGNYDDDSCLEWSEATDCPEGEACNGDGTACEDPCIDACSVGEKKCDGNVLAECIEEPGFNCPVWKRTNCAKNQYCDSEKTECRYACGDDCEPFSIIIIPDTQYMVETSARMNLNNQSVTKENSLMMQQMKWIVDNQTKENIRFVIHLGDVTQYNWSMASNDEQKWENEWEHSVYAIEKLAQAGIRFSISTGNHDYVASDLTMLLPARNKTKFSTYYNDDWLKDNYKGSTDWFGGYYDGPNSYSVFSVGDLHFMVIALEFYPRKDVIAWADEILNREEYKDYHVIVETHAYLAKKSVFVEQHETADPFYQAEGMGGRALFDEFIKRHSNIFMVVGGHSADVSNSERDNLFGHRVHEILTDYSAESPRDSCCLYYEKDKSLEECSLTDGCCRMGLKNSGNGWFRKLKMDPKSGEVIGSTITVVDDNESVYGSVNPQKHLFCKSSDDRNVEDKNKNNGADYNQYPHYHTFTIDDLPLPAEHEYCDKTNPDCCKKENAGKESCRDNYDGNFVSRRMSRWDDSDLDMPLNHHNPVVAVHSDGSFVSAWEMESIYLDSAGKEHQNTDIVFRLFKRGGYANGGPKYVTAPRHVNLKSPDIAMDGNGNFVIVWADNSSNKQYDIKMVGFNRNGGILFSERMVNDISDGEQTLPKIAMGKDGRFVVVWNDKQGNDNMSVRYKAFNANGEAIGKENTIKCEVKNNNETTTGTCQNPDIAMDDNNNYVIVWDDDNDNNGAYNIKAQKYCFDGSASGDVIVVNSDPAGQQIDAAVSMNSKGAFFVAWRDARMQSGLYAVHVRGWDENLKEIVKDTMVYGSKDENKDGKIEGKEVHNCAQPTVCVDDAGNAVVGFYDANAGHKAIHNAFKKKDPNCKDSCYDYYESEYSNKFTNFSKEYGDVLMVAVSGSNVGNKAVSPASIVAYDQKQPSVACTGDGHVVVGYADDADGDGIYETYVRGYNRVEDIQ